MKPSKVKKVKGWAVLNDGKLDRGTMIESGASCFCDAMGYDAPPIFLKKKDAESYKTWLQNVVPCTITYQIPSNKKK